MPESKFLKLVDFRIDKIKIENSSLAKMNDERQNLNF